MNLSEAAALSPVLPIGARGLVDGSLRDLALTLGQEAARLSGRLAPATRWALMRTLRAVNGYYSNLIEGHRTRLADIERAMRADYSSDKEKRDLQQEARAHLLVQEWLEEQALAEGFEVTSPQLLKRIHARFYEPLPEPFRWIEDVDGNRRREVIPGHFRTEEVEVGRHLAPEPTRVAPLMELFHQRYRPATHHGDDKYLAAAAAHHRLLWIHPFLDGNGRVARLFSHAYLTHISGGPLLWSASRGLARGLEPYRAALVEADSPRRGDLDGRGALSAQGLEGFVRFFLESCLDQVRFMDSLLNLGRLRERVLGYAAMRAAGVVPGAPRLRAEAGALLAETLLRGELPRGEAARVSGLGERTARTLVSELLREGLLESASHRAPLTFTFSAATIEYYFPRLYTGDPLSAEETSAAYAAGR
ncbi:Fic family protein [Endothiovibrio diazotrophicus]